MPSNFTTDDPILGTVDLDDKYITDAWIVDQFVSNGLWLWGLNNYGQLGLGDQTPRSSPVQVGALTNWRLVACGGYYTAAIKIDGTLWTWGFNSTGQLGSGTITSRSSPVIVGALTNWRLVACGGDNAGGHTAAIKTDGTLWTWGYNALGQLGSGTVTFRSSPVIVGALTNWKLVACGGRSHTAAIKTDGTLWIWGSNGDGQLGLGDTPTPRSSPVQVGALTNWRLVAGGWYHTAAIKTDGTLWSWGRNFNGQLGLGDSGFGTYRSSPVQVGALTNWKQVACGATYTAAIKTDGTLWTWGSNNTGQLGLGDRTDRSSPVQVGALTNWKQVACGVLHSEAIKTDGTLWAWGYNASGQLGLNDADNKSSPVQVGALTNWKQVAGGQNHTAAIADGYL